MRISGRAVGGKMYAHVFLGKTDPVADTDGLRFSGTLSGGLTVTPTADAPNSKDGVFRLAKAKWGNHFRVPTALLGEQPLGFTDGAVPLDCEPGEGGVLHIKPFRFNPATLRDEPKFRHKKKPAKANGAGAGEAGLFDHATEGVALPTPAKLSKLGLQKVQSYKTPDGELFATQGEALQHLAHMERLSKFQAFEGAVVQRFTVDDKRNTNCIIIFADGRVLSFLPVGEDAYVSVAADGIEL